MRDSEISGNWFLDHQSWLLLIGGALLAVLLAVNFLCCDSPDRARILRLSGEVTIQRADETLQPEIGMMLNAQDRVITGTGAYAEIAYDDGLKNVMRINANSRVVFESSRIERFTRLFMDRGSVMIKLDGLEKGSTFKVRTPAAIAGVRGTAFGVELVGKEAVVTDYESRIFVKGLTPDFLETKDELLLSNGWKVRVAQFEKPSRVERLSAAEQAGWQAWLNAVNALPKASASYGIGAQRLAHLDGYFSFLSAGLAWLQAGIARASLSAPVLALLLFGVLALGAGKVLERVWV
ncbi:MAG: FecR domain-containing protein [Candidatus Omnitrophica bacterium]|nr:FecR domain-containing protein [Candidatus Omnitrophota bacterium]